MNFFSRDIAFFLVPGFSMIGLFSALEPLRVANMLGGDIFSWRFVSLDGGAVPASNAIPVSAEAALADIGRPDLMMICASYDYDQAMTPVVFNSVRRLAINGSLLGGVDTGAFILAGAGVLDHCSATCHWETLPAFREEYPDIDAVDAGYVIDRGRLTASGGTNALDMMLHWIGAIEGRALERRVADALAYTRYSAHPGEARANPGIRLGVQDRRLMAAISMMQDHLEDNLPLPEIAERTGLSQRQMERLFRAELQTTPQRFYLTLRLERARHLIRYSAMAVREVSIATGFTSLAHFSRSYKKQFDVVPSAERRA